MATPDSGAASLSQFKSCYARILDAKRKFLEAARYYYALSTARGVAEEEHAQALHAATVCTILSAAGPPRSRQLAVLYKDERCAALPTYTMLSKARGETA